MPEHCSDTTFWEHIYRYRFALPFAIKRRVLDIACGEGYGSFALKCAGAASVLGVDLSVEACEHACRKYGVDTKCGDATAIPAEDSSFDLITSFETIEHIAHPGQFVDECARVLTTEGTLIVSTPNRLEYRKHDSHNDFHLSEMTLGEFARLLNSRFRHIKYFGQIVTTGTMFDLASMEPWWINVKGGWRLRHFLTRRCVWARPDSASARQHPDAAVRAAESWLSRRFNPYLVRRLARNHALPWVYFVAVCNDPLK